MGVFDALTEIESTLPGAKRSAETAPRAPVEVDRVLDDLGVQDPAVRKRLRSLAQTESSFDPEARGPVIESGVHQGDRAHGLFQIMPKTAREIDPRANLNDPAQAAKLGALYFLKNLDRFGGDLDAATAAHHGGPGAGIEYLRGALGNRTDGLMKTSDYVRKIKELDGSAGKRANASAELFKLPDVEPAQNNSRAPDFNPLNQPFFGEQNQRTQEDREAIARGWNASDLARDTGTALVSGANSLIGGVASLSDPGGKVAAWARENQPILDSWKSKYLTAKTGQMRQNMAERETEGGKFVQGLLDYARNPYVAANTVAEQVPNMAAMLLPGGLVAQGARALGMSAQFAATAAQFTVGASSAGLNAGQSRDQAYAELMAQPEVAWRQMPEYAALLQQGVAPARAKEEIARDLSILPAVVGGLAGAISGSTGFEKVLFGGAKAAGKSAAINATQGFAKESGGELLEELAPQAATNLQVKQNLDGSRALTDQFGATAAQTLVASGPFAGATALAEASKKPEKVPHSPLSNAANILAPAQQFDKQPNAPLQAAGQVNAVQDAQAAPVQPALQLDATQTTGTQAPDLLTGAQATPELPADRGAPSDNFTINELKVDNQPAKLNRSPGVQSTETLGMLNSMLSNLPDLDASEGKLRQQAASDIKSLRTFTPTSTQVQENVRDPETAAVINRGQNGAGLTTEQARALIAQMAQDRPDLRWSMEPFKDALQVVGRINAAAENDADQQRRQRFDAIRNATSQGYRIFTQKGLYNPTIGDIRPLKTPAEKAVAKAALAGLPPPSDIELASMQAAQSPANDLPEPTDGQKQAGNYKKARVKLSGLDVSIETPRGAVRSGKNADGTGWQVRMPGEYGYIRRTKGADGDHVDITIGPQGDNGRFWIVNQNKPDSTKFDEHKILTGVTDEQAALGLYMDSFSGGFGSKTFGSISGELNADALKKLLPSLEKAKPAQEPRAFTAAEKTQILAERAWAKPVVEALLKRRALASFANVRAQFDRAMDRAKAYLTGADVKPGVFMALQPKFAAVKDTKTVALLQQLIDGVRANRSAEPVLQTAVTATQVAAEENTPRNAQEPKEESTRSENVSTNSQNVDILQERRVENSAPETTSADIPQVMESRVDVASQDVQKDSQKTTNADNFSQKNQEVSSSASSETSTNDHVPEQQKIEQGSSSGRQSDVRSTPERRVDTEKRIAYDSMSRDDLIKLLLVDDLTGLGNKRAYEENARMPVQVVIDADNLKWFNDNMGHLAGDQLLQKIGQSIREALPSFGKKMRGYHISGDEFAIEASSERTARAIMQDVQSRLDAAELRIEQPDGTQVSKNGIGISYGIAKTANAAEIALQEHKLEREKSGRRAARGSEPSGVARISPKRQQIAVDQPAAQEVTVSDVPPAFLRSTQVKVTAWDENIARAREVELPAGEALDAINSEVDDLQKLLRCMKG